ncbi:MAG TPA: 30S ribosomal protein S3 [bacterium]|nr:30S ribosomal protein S3 [bacterium]
MGQKVHPKGLRLKIVDDWNAKWFAVGKEYTKRLAEDLKIYNFLKKELTGAGLAKIGIERFANKLKIVLYTSKPAVIIGAKGVNKEKLESKLKKFLNRDDITLFIQDIKHPETVAQLVADRIAEQLEKRISFRKAMKKAMDLAFRRGVKGIKVQCSGRLGGADMARTEWYLEGRVPLHTLRAQIDYGFSEANTKVGKTGVKVWLFHKEVLKGDDVALDF